MSAYTDAGARLGPEACEQIRRDAESDPPLTEAQRDRLRLLLAVDRRQSVESRPRARRAS